jgi:putative two-component system response regulator
MQSGNSICDFYSGAEELVAELNYAAGQEQASILIVDDESVNLRVAEAFLQDAGYQNITLCDRPELVPSLAKRCDPDVILLDVMMPEVSGIDVLRNLRANVRSRHVPVIVLTSLIDRLTKSQALQLGATDFLNKPLDAFELLPRVRNAIIVHAHQRSLAVQAKTLERQVRQRTAELAWTQVQAILCLARASEFRDNETGRHAFRVGRYARVIAEALDQDECWCEHLMLAAMLHDVGKIGVRDSVLLKPGKLDDIEFEHMKEHCRFGEEIISPRLHEELESLLSIEFDESTPNCPMLELACRIAGTHHERWDGTGYPRGLAGEDIPLEGRITAVADVFDAVGSVRPYKAAFPISKCQQIIRDGSGNHFDPAVVDAFFARFDEILMIREQLRD